MRAHHETMLQFGAGNFLRAFVDLFVEEARAAGQEVGRIVVVQSTPGPRAEWINAQGGRYHVLLRGVVAGERVDRATEVGSIRRAIVAADRWDEVLTVARSPHLRHIVSNTTELGYALDPADTPDSAVPRSFPARLLRLLEARFRAGQGGVMILPCELHEDNGDRLRGIVVDLAHRWGTSPAFTEWIETSCVWANTLVDRIVTGRPSEHPLLAKDRLLVTAEPYARWIIESRDGRLALFDHPAIRLVDDVAPYRLRKVRILNGAHTALVARTRGTAIRTVREAVRDPEIGAWLRELLREEILPAIDDRIANGAHFVEDTLERFVNPYLEHRLVDIALHHDAKIKVRLEPTRRDYRTRFGCDPRRLSALLAGENC